MFSLCGNSKSAKIFNIQEIPYNSERVIKEKTFPVYVCCGQIPTQKEK